MAKKSSQRRLTVPQDIWDIVNFDMYNRKEFGFFITEDKRVVIMPINSGIKKALQFIGKCPFDEKHRFFIPANVDTYLGDGEDYYFSTYITPHCIYLYRLTKEIIKLNQEKNTAKLLKTLSRA